MAARRVHRPFPGAVSHLPSPGMASAKSVVRFTVKVAGEAIGGTARMMSTVSISSVDLLAGNQGTHSVMVIRLFMESPRDRIAISRVICPLACPLTGSRNVYSIYANLCWVHGGSAVRLSQGRLSGVLVSKSSHTTLVHWQYTEACNSSVSGTSSV